MDHQIDFSNSQDQMLMENLLNESWSAWAWLEGYIDLADWARKNKAKRLKAALTAIESRLFGEEEEAHD